MTLSTTRAIESIIESADPFTPDRYGRDTARNFNAHQDADAWLELQEDAEVKLMALKMAARNQVTTRHLAYGNVIAANNERNRLHRARNYS